MYQFLWLIFFFLYIFLVLKSCKFPCQIASFSLPLPHYMQPPRLNFVMEKLISLFAVGKNRETCKKKFLSNIDIM